MIAFNRQSSNICAQTCFLPLQPPSPPMAQQLPLVIVGTVAFDSIETPFGKADRVIGGAGTYGALAASHFTEGIGLVSVIGDDFPEESLAMMRSRGIDTEGIQRVAGQESFFWAGKYHLDMNSRDTLETRLNVLADFDPVLPQAYRSPRLLMLGNLTPSVQMRVLDQMESRPALIAMDTMNFWMDIAWDSLLETIARVDLLTINDEEARQLSGERSLLKAARKIATMGPRYLIIKKGEHGALLFGDGDIFFAPALPLEEVCDPTGAGDSFAGGLMGYLASQPQITVEHLKQGILCGSALASCTVEAFGTSSLEAVTEEVLRDRLRIFDRLTRISLG